MAKKYIYKGRSRIVSKIPEVKNDKPTILIDSCSVVIMASNPMSGIKKLGCPLINDSYDDEVMNLYLDGMKSFIKSPNIIIVGGYNIKKILKHDRRNEYIIVENILFDLTNSAEDLRVAINATSSGPILVFDANFIPSKKSMQLLLEDKNQSSLLYSKRVSNLVGCDVSKGGFINYFGYKCPNKIKGAYYLSSVDADKMRKRICGSTFNKNKFDFEMLTELRIKAKEDTSTSSRLDENYED